jgi:hypothetical protein
LTKRNNYYIDYLWREAGDLLGNSGETSEGVGYYAFCDYLKEVRVMLMMLGLFMNIYEKKIILFHFNQNHSATSSLDIFFYTHKRIRKER